MQMQDIGAYKYKNAGFVSFGEKYYINNIFERV